MNEILENFSPAALIVAIEANAVETCTRLGRTSRGQRQENPEVVWYSTGVASAFYNMVVCAHFEPDAVDLRIEETMQHFKARQVPMSSVSWSNNQAGGFGQASGSSRPELRRR